MSEPKKLYRRPKEGKIFGVVAGLAEYFELDVTLLRVIFVVLVFAGAGFIIPIYLLLALLLPTSEAEARAGVSSKSVQANFSKLSSEFRDSGAVDRTKNYLGIGLIVVGSWLFLGRLFPEIFDFRWDYFWPIALIVVGLLFLIKRGGRAQ